MIIDLKWVTETWENCKA